MAVSKYHEMMLPVLEYLDVHLHLTDGDRTETIPSGFARYANNAQWVWVHLKQVIFIQFPKRGFFRITERGKEYLERGKTAIGRNDLLEFPEFKAFATKSNEKKQPMQPRAHDPSPHSILPTASEALRFLMIDFATCPNPTYNAQASTAPLRRTSLLQIYIHVPLRR